MSGFDPDLFTPIDSKEDAWYEKAAYDYELDAANDWLQEQIADAFGERSIESVRTYLGMYGDAVTERVQGAIAEAQALLDSGHLGPATAVAHTAVEIIVRDLVVRSILHGAFLSDQWAEILARQIVRDAPGEPRRLLPLLAEAWELDIDEIRLASGAAAWGVFTNEVTRARNNFAHRADPVPSVTAARAVECARVLLQELGGALAQSVGMNWPANPWHMGRSVQGLTTKLYERRDPYSTG